MTGVPLDDPDRRWLSFSTGHLCRVFGQPTAVRVVWRKRISFRARTRLTDHTVAEGGGLKEFNPLPLASLQPAESTIVEGRLTRMVIVSHRAPRRSIPEPYGIAAVRRVVVDRVRRRDASLARAFIARTEGMLTQEGFRGAAPA
jgi:hypothetical protein